AQSVEDPLAVVFFVPAERIDAELGHALRIESAYGVLLDLRIVERPGQLGHLRHREEARRTVAREVVAQLGAAEHSLPEQRAVRLDRAAEDEVDAVPGLVEIELVVRSFRGLLRPTRRPSETGLHQREERLGALAAAERLLRPAEALLDLG